jgi:hypothetical protein
MAESELTRRQAAGDPSEALAELRSYLGRAAWETGDHERGRREVQRAHDDAGPGAPQLRDDAAKWLELHPVP